MGLKTDLIAVWCESADPVADQHTNGLTLTNIASVGTATGKVGTAADFESGSSQSLRRNDEALISTGDISFTEAVWVNMESKALSGSNNYIMNKGSGSSNDERSLLYRNSAAEDRFRFYIANFAVGVAANTFGSPSTGTWYYLQAQHDAAGNKIRIRVNDGAWDEAATGGTAPTDATGNLYLGAYDNAGTRVLFFDGLINQYAFWKALKSDADLNAIYNSGNGLAFSSWDVATAKPHHYYAQQRQQAA
jgi:hypothetical protein